MGAQQNIRLAGDARRRQMEGLAQRRRAAMGGEMPSPSTTGGPSDNPAVVGELASVSPNTVMRQEMFAARPGMQTPLQTENPQFAPGIAPVIPGPGRIFEGSPEYEQMRQRLRGLNLYGDRGRFF